MPAYLDSTTPISLTLPLCWIKTSCTGEKSESVYPHPSLKRSEMTVEIWQSSAEEEQFLHFKYYLQRLPTFGILLALIENTHSPNIRTLFLQLVFELPVQRLYFRFNICQDLPLPNS